jgi:hypothetical protein
MPSGVSDGTFRFDLIGFVKADLGEVIDEPKVQVDLLRIPVAVLQKASEEYEALFRELRLIKEHAESHPHATSRLPERLSVLLAEIGTRFNGFGPGVDESWQAVVDSKVHTYDWHLRLPTSALGACELYNAMLDEADEFGLEANLLTLPASPESVAVRRWFLAEIIAQLQGRTPTPWTESPAHHALIARVLN